MTASKDIESTQQRAGYTIETRNRWKATCYLGNTLSRRFRVDAFMKAFIRSDYSITKVHFNFQFKLPIYLTI